MNKSVLLASETTTEAVPPSITDRSFMVYWYGMVYSNLIDAASSLYDHNS
jgi:hypothetical protein